MQRVTSRQASQEHAPAADKRQVKEGRGCVVRLALYPRPSICRRVSRSSLWSLRVRNATWTAAACQSRRINRRCGQKVPLICVRVGKDIAKVSQGALHMARRAACVHVHSPLVFAVLRRCGVSAAPIAAAPATAIRCALGAVVPTAPFPCSAASSPLVSILFFVKCPTTSTSSRHCTTE